MELPEEAENLYGGTTYAKLKEKFSDAFDDFEIDIDEIEDATDEEIKEFFQRLQEGFPLSSSEKLNAVHSKLRNFSRALTNHRFFTETVDFKNKRYAHFDVAAKVMSIEIDGLEVGARYEDLKAVFESNKNFSSTSKTAKKVQQALEFLHKALPKSSPFLKSRSLTQSVVTLACKLVEHNVPENAAKKFGAFVARFSSDLSKQVELGHEATDPDLIEFQKTVNANVKTGPKTRHAILLRKLFEFEPRFAEYFDALAIKTSGIDKEITRLAKSVQQLISQINEAEAATTGKDLFKATNKTTSALSNIGSPASDYEEYKALVEDLYFLLWEGPGSKLAGKEPESFKEVNSLRTALQHDVDHGSSSKVKKKNKDLGSVFQAYSGVASPAVSAPERFPVVHLKLLTKIEGDLRAMKMSYEAAADS